MRVEQLTWVEYRDRVATSVVVLPIGAIDGHGPHLPLSTDTVISEYLARRLEDHADVLLLPALPYSRKTEPPASGGEFTGVTHLRASTLTDAVLDLLRASHRNGARRFLLIDCHKANAGAVREAADLFIDGVRDARVMVVTWWDLVSEDTRNAIAAETGVGRMDDHHAAMVETSLVMHIAPELVREDLLADDPPVRRERYLILPVPDELRTRTGVVYRASRASAEIGARVLEEVTTRLVDAVKIELM